MITKSVKFIRKNGRIIPILVGGAVGASVGHAAFSVKKHQEINIQKDLKANRVSAAALVKKSGMKNVNLLATKQDVQKHFSSSNFLVRNQLNQAVKMARQGQNAFALRYNDKDYLIVGKKANKDVVGHELGHIRDFRKNGSPGFFETGLLGSFTGKTLLREKKAWKMSPFCSQHNKKHKHSDLKNKALSTYEAGQSGSRFGAVAGAGAGLAYSLLKAVK